MKILCGYNVNIDSVYRISGTELSELLESFESAEILDKIENPPGRIESVSDFAAGLAYCMKNGCGAEWLVFEHSVFEFLKERYFEKSLVRMGGNAGIMANALSELGASLVVPNVAVPSKAQLSLFSGKNMYFPGHFLPSSGSSGPSATTKSPGGGPAEAATDQDPIHFVFDFSEGDSFSLYGTRVTVPRENRFIATCDQLNFRLFTSPAFEAYALGRAGDMDGALISGFHLLLDTYPDGSSYEKFLGNALTQLRAWKAENENLRVHLEFGHFASREIAVTVFLRFAGLSDSMGMNEDELALFCDLHGVQPEGIRHMDAEAVGKAAAGLASRHRLRKLLVHTREFVLSALAVGSSPVEAPALLREAEKELEALEFGVRCAGTYAATGRLDGRKFVDNKSEKLEESGFGREQLSRFLDAFEGQALGRGAFALSGGYLLCMLPTLLSKSPVTTVGLGDTLTSGTFLRRLELDVQA